MKKEDVKKVVMEAVKIFSEQKPNVDITEETNLVGDLNFDELNMVEFVMNLEETIGMEIDDDDMEKYFNGQTVGSVIDYIAEKTKLREE